ncbi:glycosyltransferase family 2 protein [Gorillibacterium sp. CAU 1737]|uniref:glycosyltransferase family 2 protein n=1 Tax=Gorillibacterium sp. CAU 1737 TaxID=3140362 RepID=UPI0032615A3A
MTNKTELVIQRVGQLLAAKATGESGGSVLVVGCLDPHQVQLFESHLSSPILTLIVARNAGEQGTEGGLEAQLIERMRDQDIQAIVIHEVLEHCDGPEGFLRCIRKVMEEFNPNISLVVTVKNYVRSEVATNLLFGRVDQVQLDVSRNVYDEGKLMDLFQSSGFEFAEAMDLLDDETEASKTSVARLIEGMSSAKSWNTYCFIRELHYQPNFTRQPESEGPFLTVVTRTIGNRPQELKEVLLCLSTQTSQDFEVIIVGHNVKRTDEQNVLDVIEHSPTWIRNKIRYIPIFGGGRSRPLNVGFAAARGSYVSILDDDDIVLANWVKTFQDLSETGFGKILKSVSVRQEYERMETSYSSLTSAAVSGFIRDYPAEVDFLQMLHHNQCPGLCLAFPTAVYQKLGYHFDESLNTTEDWDFILRVYSICGIESSPEVTNIYRWWRKGSSSATIHQQNEWEKNYDYVLSKIDDAHLILPPGNIKRIVFLINYYNANSREAYRSELVQEFSMATEEKRVLVREILRSKSWRVTAPVRVLQGFLGKKTVIPDYETASDEQLTILVENLLNTKSWRYTRWLRDFRRRRNAKKVG